MAYDDLRSLLRALERDGDLKRIKAEVDPYLEIGEIVDRVNKAGGPALLFENVKGSDMPLAMNVFGTDRRLLKSLGLKSFDQITEKIGSLLKPELPQGFMGMRDALGKLGSVAHIPPKKVKDAPVQEVVLQGDQVDLERLPALFTWPEDGGSFFNLGLTHTKSPVNGMRNLGLYRLQRHDKRTIGMHWQIHKNSHNHYQLAAQRGERLPVAIAFGCPPAVTYASTAPLPGDMDEYLFAGFLQGKRVEMVDCKTVPLQVPAQAEVVLEGWLEPGEMLPEGPFGDHTGFYTPQEPFPALTIDCVTMRRRPLLQSIVVGRPPTEDGPLGRATERFFLPLLKIIIPDIVDYHLPEAGGFHNCAIVSIDKKYPKHAQKVMHAVWGAHMMSLTKLIIVVDADCDVHDLHEVAWRALGNTDYARDLTVVEGPVDHLDHSSYQQFWGGKAGIDATRKLPEEGYTRDGGWPEMVVSDPDTATLVDKRWKEYGL
ncbi:menaquinone biosynthesis decarboxylase [Streptomyces sp. CHA1]|uniref:menaquinone biosynthesis decarboxylase n=1 Tax=Streptomyces TaxID=1883 RepID=UPI000300D9CE|nr:MULTISPECIES: menaquinone biosynthesis decarboxylase [unclassified Streptomyces]QPA00787.1 menaquinone biosynthesis decarboxylase [Streptomyces violascens]WDV32574.1 menaquinone biosynthesis decarboxylase [Streptomyces sp. AD16]WSB20936.1 menaquinone biosynthesis decarboxylase [Streptomyces albidoflavus]ESP98505.1 UbiD family decarboxylase [Streptomyces sp. GBA 94-10 4N24]ESQ04146.1 UbiD family decarboxylase [Streptomyces sp. PVA_94-07]